MEVTLSVECFVHYDIDTNDPDVALQQALEKWCNGERNDMDDEFFHHGTAWSEDGEATDYFEDEIMERVNEIYSR